VEQVGDCFPKVQQKHALLVQAEAKTTDLIVKARHAKTATASAKLSCFNSDKAFLKNIFANLITRIDWEVHFSMEEPTC
jgi:hypothetical protein